jgi:hypothetical protein
MEFSNGGAGSEFNPILMQVALLCTTVGCCISFFSVWLHWKNYRKPVSFHWIINNKAFTLHNRINKDKLFAYYGCM